MADRRLKVAEYRIRNLLRRRGVELVRVSQGPRAESLLALHLDKLFSSLHIDVVLDVGARVGDYALWLRLNGFKGTIVSFEPVASSFTELSHRAATDDRWHVVNLALGAEDGSAAINVTKRTEFSSFLTPNQYALDEFEEGTDVDHVEDVSVRRLDGVLPGVLDRLGSHHVYLKMDTQGWDLEVLRGATGVLGGVDALQSEVSVRPIYTGMPDFRASLEQLEDLGFSLSGLFPVNLDSRGCVVEFDCVCVADHKGAAHAAEDYVEDETVAH